jgi:hypothetical protein
MRQMVARDIGVGNKNPEPAIAQKPLNTAVKLSPKVVTWSPRYTDVFGAV